MPCRGKAIRIFRAIKRCRRCAKGRAEAVGTSLCNRRLASYRLSYLEALEFGML